MVRVSGLGSPYFTGEDTGSLSAVTWHRVWNSSSAARPGFLFPGSCGSLRAQSARRWPAPTFSPCRATRAPFLLTGALFGLLA